MDTLAKVAFAFSSYLSLLIFVVASYGAGYVLVVRPSAVGDLEEPLASLIGIATGIGVIVVVLFGLGTLGLLTTPGVAAVLATGVSAAAFSRGAVAWSHIRGGGLRALLPQARRHWAWVAIAALAALPLLVRPLQPPLEWDELMYHLPYARFWAEEGELAVNPYLRYPLFPYNFDLLYAGALLFGNDIVPHLLHALAGWLVAAGIYLGASRYFDRWVGLLAAIFFLSTVSWGFANAYVDLGLTLFVFFSFLNLALWYEKSNHAFLYLAVGFLGLAIGTKYTGLLHVPIFAVLVLVRERRPTLLVKLALLFVVSGGYWYLRNYLISGDPVHPLAGEYFGYWLWDRGDMEDQAADIERMRDFIPRVYVPALAAWLLLKGSSTTFKGLGIVAYAALSMWFATSQYERYLTPAFPFLAILSAVVIVRLGRLEPVQRTWRWLSERRTVRLLTVLKIALVLIVAQKSVKAAAHYFDHVFPSADARSAFLADRFASYEIFRIIEHDRTWRVYQLGFEGELYYATVFVVGDVFGPGRYREVYARAKDAAALAEYFRTLGLNGFLINLSRSPFKEVEFDERLEDHFDLVIRTDRSVLYRLRNSKISAHSKGTDRPFQQGSSPLHCLDDWASIAHEDSWPEQG